MDRYRYIFLFSEGLLGNLIIVHTDFVLSRNVMILKHRINLHRFAMGLANWEEEILGERCILLTNGILLF